MVFWGRRNRKPSRVIAVSVDDNATKVLSWAVTNLVQEEDYLHIIGVEEPCAGPYPAEVPDVLCPTTNVIKEHRQEARQHELHASSLLAGYRQTACSLGVKPHRVALVQLPPKGGASGVAESLVQYVHGSNASMVVVGSRGMGNFHRMLSSLWGLGSVSDYLVVHAACPVVVVKKGDCE